MQWVVFFYFVTNVDGGMCTTVLSDFFGLVLTQNIFVSLCRALNFLFHLGTQLIKKGEEVVYNHFYHG